ncbi:ASCH domain-containing protein [Streptococcus sp. zg-86]|uniref:ASCH domain-containing protein n=1 Tax=Streptococcus zhangguiae TaxID=2664091 RepID=A0A6I4RUI8_9STRE|nr:MULTISPECIES: ASCH domain-containing protein [unclassified Streptococcus]MTB64885.1 ASCH domain-containing protein [Streptococcus sp. zg-86]MTB91045.1 ASCH domain-containing protein [Streptococcus sp. zg-36]MWV56872.1 ASCH domain-containing protein [Streptococcus sp. zg-70]QTH48326.1 ASCH domain-containing protein [Streptococcus sp. zg-86]
MTAEEMWEAYRLINPHIGDEVDAWQFGAEPDVLADLVLRGEKTATASVYDEYLVSGEILPKVGERSVILDSSGQAVCVIETKKVTIEPFYQVSAAHAFKEGEGDKSLDYWRRVHEDLFSKWLTELGLAFSIDSRVVLEEFEVVYPLS